MGYLTISTNVRRNQHITDDIFSFTKTAYWCTCIVHTTQSNCCGALNFLSPEPYPPTAWSWMHWLQDLGSHTAVWVWVVSQKDWRNQGITSWILAMHWYTIWVKKCDFRVSQLFQIVQKHKLLGVAQQRILIAYFIGNISAKKYPDAFTYVKVITNQRWDVFLRHSVMYIVLWKVVSLLMLV